MRNIICVPFAYEEGMKSGVNMTADQNLIIKYLKNVCVALVTSKYYNPECEVIFATNFSEEQLPNTIRETLKCNEIIIKKIDFDCFKFDKDYKWGLAFYKLCVLKHFTDEEFDHFCYLDSDVYVQDSFNPIWKEADQNIMLFNINHGFNKESYNIFIDEYERFNGQTKYITHYGGEFFAANYSLAKKMLDIEMAIYERMIKDRFVTSKGDEFIVNMAAEELKPYIKNAGAYIFRFWTGRGFRLISTQYKYNAVVCLHMPDEKSRGIIKIYDKYISKGVVPDSKRVWKLCRITMPSILDILKSIVLAITPQKVQLRMKKARSFSR